MSSTSRVAVGAAFQDTSYFPCFTLSSSSATGVLHLLLDWLKYFRKNFLTFPCSLKLKCGQVDQTHMKPVCILCQLIFGVCLEQIHWICSSRYIQWHFITGAVLSNRNQLSL